MQNVLGQRFDLMQPGIHALLNIPKGSQPQDALLDVHARAVHLGGQCADMYFEVVNVTGEWAETAAPGGLHFSAGGSGEEFVARWVQLGPVGLKVVRGHGSTGTAYLNLFLRNAAQTGYHVGGLLGEDSHELEATPTPQCQESLSLAASPVEDDDDGELQDIQEHQQRTASIAQVLVQ